ncbi:MAG: ABC transporter ATP-binding protein [Vallitaleaceae bacterium]|nr:ABC transporter ATP-binding protein [Vallitaleaceae bacterium]
MLVVKDLVAGYEGLPAIHGVTFEVKEGQIVALLGSNGAGKTTALRAITGAISPYSGVVELNGKSLIGTPIHKITGLGISMVPEGRHLFPKMSIMDNLLMGAYSIKDKNLIARKLEEVYEVFPRIKERRNQIAGTMSGGEQQMVAIARALMSNPKLLILDEPSLGIMPKLVDEIFEFIKKINKEGITIIIVEQNADKTLQFADYAYVLGNGEVLIEGTGKELLNDDHVKQIYLGLE